MKRLRKIIEIDESKCNGCGQCVSACHEGALAMVDGKAKLVKDSYCDGLGACIGECPQDAIKIIEREADDFVMPEHAEQPVKAQTPPPLPCGCPGTLSKVLERKKTTCPSATPAGEVESELRQWPVQLHLVPVNAPYWKNADLLIAADCVAVAYGDFQRKLLKGHSVIIACPKLDDTRTYFQKLSDIISMNEIKSVTVAYMEVPCCNGIMRMAEDAVMSSGKNIELKKIKISLSGEVLQ